MKKVAIVYGSSSDNTKNAANMIAKKLFGEDVKVMDVSQLSFGDLDSYPNIILGTSTWGLGDLQDDWDSKLSDLKNSNLSGKTVAFFGLGDAISYSDTFVDGMGILYDMVKDKDCKIVGQTPTNGYSFDSSKAVENDSFVGLALDEDNESDKTEDRISVWVGKIQSSLQ
jgi:flavodoxin I